MFLCSVCPQIAHRHIFVMIIIIYVSQISLRASFYSFSRIQRGRQIKNGRHLSETVYYHAHLSSVVFLNNFHYAWVSDSTKIINIFHFDSYVQIQDGLQLQNGRHFTLKGYAAIYSYILFIHSSSWFSVFTFVGLKTRNLSWPIRESKTAFTSKMAGHFTSK